MVDQESDGADKAGQGSKERLPELPINSNHLNATRIEKKTTYIITQPHDSKNKAGGKSKRN